MEYSNTHVLEFIFTPLGSVSLRGTLYSNSYKQTFHWWSLSAFFDFYISVQYDIVKRIS